MNQIKEIISDYVSADEEQRLSMFLSHRDLRQEFTEIDMNEMKSWRNEITSQKNGLDHNRRSHGLTRTCWGWLKHCCSAR